MEELEEALRESVKITAQREMVMAEQHVNIEQQDKQVGHAGALWEMAVISLARAIQQACCIALMIIVFA